MQVVERQAGRPVYDCCTTGAVLTVDLSAIAANYRYLQKMIGVSSCAAVLKADAYGLGVCRVAPVLARAGCRRFFVAHIDEGVTLRNLLGPSVEIVILHGAMLGSETICWRYDLIPVLNDSLQLESWKKLARRLSERLPAILQIDTGMARFGFGVDEALLLLDDPSTLESIELRQLISHLACADDPDDPTNSGQLAAFRKVRQRIPMVSASLAASSGIFLGNDYHFDMVRPGAALYGLAPQHGRKNPMKPVVSLRGQVIQLRSVPAGTPVGYGHSEITSRASELATVGVGYADGFLRSAASARTVGWNGHRIPVLGRVSMDSIILDVTDLPANALSPGTFVDIIGPDHNVDAVAADAGTIGYEVLAGLGQRFHRIYLGS